MNKRKSSLAFGWSIEAHKDCTLYSNGNQFLLLDWESDMVLRCIVDEKTIEFEHVSWNLRFKVDLQEKLIFISNDPEDEDNQ